MIAARAFVTGFSGAAMPGPVLAATIFYAAGPLGWRAGLAIMFGHLLLEISLVIALLLGLARWLRSPRSPLVRAVGLVGGLMLLLMGADMLRAVPGLSLAQVAERPLPFGAVTAGAVLSASNGYFWLWWSTIGLGLLAPAQASRGRAGALVFYLAHYSSDLVWYTLVAAMVASGAGLIGDGPFRALIALCGLTLLGFGLRSLWLAWRPPAELPADGQRET